ncbi:hypothetical protein OJ996_16270 [Luteolibacter sp. GHJ8]|uniref:Uncharacterized protein n=1 Tax=Luteolibacter rhizosphaerae TaxID=2989719 RepID=A0ABT3G5L6_9BACT|nr:hypothetical protein [Luteolibacter rhizosphaerae]MCW1915143.1 hypothetical protein [Luteolibacter rhizosphaerae]
MTTLTRSFEDAPALPFVPFQSTDPDALRASLAIPPARCNRRRRRPPLVMAVSCFLSCTASVIATSSPVEQEMTAMAPSIHAKIIDVRTAMFGSEIERAQMSFNAVLYR